MMTKLFGKVKFFRCEHGNGLVNKPLVLFAFMLVLVCFSEHIRALENINIEPSARYRYQEISDPLRGDAQASTLKLRLSADWAFSSNWQAIVQLDHVEAFTPDNYNSMAFMSRSTSPIADVADSEINHAYLRYSSDSNWALAIGRQGIVFDNQRHVGNIEFWQQDQSFDAVVFEYNDQLSWSGSYSYVSKVQRIFGRSAKSQFSSQDIRFGRVPQRSTQGLGIHNHDTHLINVSYGFDEANSLTGYVYLIDNETRPEFSSNTIGLRALGSIKPNAIKWGYVAEYAYQQGANNNPRVYSASYVMLEASAQINSHLFSATFEHLGDDNAFGFVTSLGDNHRFQGWADVFNDYLQNTSGMNDLSLSYRGRDKKLRWRVKAHQFVNTRNNQTIGHELNAQLAYRYTRKWEFQLIASKYFADEGIPHVGPGSEDLTSLLFQVSYDI